MAASGGVGALWFEVTADAAGVVSVTRDGGVLMVTGFLAAGMVATADDSGGGFDAGE